MSLQDASLLCKNKCGYFGNPLWDNYCSKCYRNLQASPQRDNIRSFNRSPSNPFSKFEEKRKQIAGKGALTVKNIFKSSRDGSRGRGSQLPESQQQASDEFFKQIQHLKSRAYNDFVSQVTKIVDPSDTFQNLDQYSTAVQECYNNLAERFNKESCYSSLSAKQKEELTEVVEKFVSSWIHSWAFGHASHDDEREDSKLQEKIRSLEWVTPDLIGAPIDMDNMEQAKCIEECILPLTNMSSVPSTNAKLENILLCCRKAVKLVDIYARSLAKIESTEMVGNADDFLPALIWILLKANPPQLTCNLRFITRFTNQNKLSSGESGYYFTSLFVKNLTHESLKMSEEEFHRRMRGVHPPSKNSTEGQKIWAENEANLLDLEDNFAKLGSKMDDLEKDLISFEADFVQSARNMHFSYSQQLAMELDSRQLENPQLLLLEPISPSPKASAEAPLIDL